MKVPSYQRRRLAAAKPPMGVVHAYQALLARFFEGLNPIIEKVFLTGWATNPVHHSGRVDASTYITKRLGTVKVALEEAITPSSAMSRDIRVLAARVSKKGDIEFRRLVGISPRAELGVGAALDAFRDRNVDLIKSLAGRQIQEITDILATGEIEALRVEDLRTQIQARFDVTKSKADLLARDQVLKLNGNLTQVRQQAVGISRYIWTTSHDERVRGTPGGKWPKGLHYDLDGTIHDWNTPPICSEDGRREHPGGDYQCRCTAFPILPELEEAGEDVKPGLDEDPSDT